MLISSRSMSISLFRFILPLLSLFLASLWSPWVEARTIYVDCDYNSENGGTSWSDAIGMRDVNNMASDGDVVYIKARIYTYITPVVFQKKLELYGGFSGNESPSDPEHRDWWNNQTIIRGSGTSGIRTEAEARIDGFFFEDCSGSGILSAATATIINCVFQNNGSRDYDGAIYHLYLSKLLTLVNCLIVDNDYNAQNGEYIPVELCHKAINLSQGSPLTMIHCTIADNDVVGREGYYGISSSKKLKIVNSIIRDTIEPPTGPADVTYSNIIGGFEGEGNIDVDPSFGSQYKLLPDSPCIDTGTKSEVYYDIRNLERPVDIPGVGFDGSVAFDMGAFEFQTSEIPTPTQTLTPTITETPLPTPTIDSHADINGDGKIGPEDLLILQREWGRKP